MNTNSPRYYTLRNHLFVEAFHKISYPSVTHLGCGCAQCMQIVLQNLFDNGVGSSAFLAYKIYKNDTE
jgi:hypothetical protein